MGLLRKKHDITDIYGIKKEKSVARLPEGRSRNSYSRAYHNHFRGYTEVMRKNAKGRMVIERYYTKPWIVSGLSAGHYWLVRALYALLTAASIVLFITALSQDVPANHFWLVAIPGLPTVTILFLQAVFCVLYVTVPKKMTVWDHISSTKRLKMITRIAAGTQGLTAFALAGYVLVTQQEVSQTLLCALTTLIAAVCSMAIFLVERKVPYTEIPNEIKLPEGEAHEIR